VIKTVAQTSYLHEGEGMKDTIIDKCQRRHDRLLSIGYSNVAVYAWFLGDLTSITASNKVSNGGSFQPMTKNMPSEMVSNPTIFH
jgi:hypothetical protein